jgi:hypothetical protein
MLKNYFSLFIMSNCCLAHWLPKFELFVGGIQVVH